MDYQGYKTCASVKLFFGGPDSCKFSCIGFGDCVEVCAYDAIHIRDGIAVVDRDKCVGCKLCATACPQNIIAMLPQKSRVFVGCSSNDPGKRTKDICEVGCIACKLCEKACKFDAVHVENNLAKIDPEKCTNCGLCVKACPKDIIHMIPKAKTPKVIA
jgi:ferredoxin